MKPLGPHAEPPPDFATFDLPLAHLHHAWFRIHRTARAPLFFGKTGDNRFDAPSREFGVLYAGKDEHCAFVETFGHSTGYRFVVEAELDERSLARVDVTRPLALVDLSGPGLARIGADARLTAGDYEAAQRWALAIHQHPRRPDGIAYLSRHDPSRLCAALFERCRDALTVTGLGSLGDRGNRPLMAALLDHYDFGLV